MILEGLLSGLKEGAGAYADVEQRDRKAAIENEAERQRMENYARFQAQAGNETASFRAKLEENAQTYGYDPETGVARTKAWAAENPEEAKGLIGKAKLDASLRKETDGRTALQKNIDHFGKDEYLNLTRAQQEGVTMKDVREAEKDIADSYTKFMESNYDSQITQKQFAKEYMPMSYSIVYGNVPDGSAEPMPVEDGEPKDKEQLLFDKLMAIAENQSEGDAERELQRVEQEMPNLGAKLRKMWSKKEKGRMQDTILNRNIKENEQRRDDRQPYNQTFTSGQRSTLN